MGDREVVVVNPPEKIALPSGVETVAGQWDGQIAALLAEAKAVTTIKTQAQADKAAEVHQAFGEKGRTIENVRKLWVAAPNALVKALNGLFTKRGDALEPERRRLGGLLNQWTMDENKRRADEAKAEQDRLNKNYNAQVKRAEAKGKEAPPPPPVVEAVAVTKVGVATARMVWTYEITNINAIPKQFLEVKDGELKRELARLERENQPVEIAGIKASKVAQVAS